MTYASCRKATSGARRTRAVLAIAAACLAFGVDMLDPARAEAYLDPMTGSAVLQALIGGALGGMYFLRRYWQTIRKKLGMGRELSLRNGDEE
jgi:hypothetical protein